MNGEPEDRVFLSYASEDVDEVYKIYQGLKKRSVNVWFDKKNMGLGIWKDQIIRAIGHSRYFIICLSENALRKTGMEAPGFQDHELATAYEFAGSSLFQVGKSNLSLPAMR